MNAWQIIWRENTVPNKLINLIKGGTKGKGFIVLRTH